MILHYVYCIEDPEGLKYYGVTKNTQSVLTEIDVVAIRSVYANNEYTQLELSQIYGVTRETISAVVRGKSWPHVGGPLTVKKWQDKKTSQGVIDNIIELRKNKVTYNNIALQLGISRNVAAKYGKEVS